MEQIPNGQRNIFNSSCFLLGPDGTMRLETSNSIDDVEKKSIIKFSFLADILGPEWTQHKKIWIHLTNRNIIVPRDGYERKIVGILYKTEYDDYIQLGLALSTEGLLAHANLIQQYKSEIRLRILIDAHPDDWCSQEFIDLMEISVSSSYVPQSS